MINNEAPPPPQSPWKKPRVSLLKTKSFKRKSEIFNSINNDSINSSKLQADNSIAEDSEFCQNPKERKTVLNRFSIKNTTSFSFSKDSSLNESNLKENLNSADERNDLSSFFTGTREEVFACNLSNEEKIQSDKKLSQQQSNNTSNLNAFCPSAISSLKSRLLLDSAKPEKIVKEQEVFAFEHEKLIPIDWSLKTRLRFLSTRQFSCNTGVKSQNESEAISNYASFKSFYSNLNNRIYNTAEQNKNLYKTLLCESLNYWTFPCLPWINLYPRNSVSGNLSTMLEPLHLEIQKSLAKTWNQSFKSLYNSLKCNECPYFYVLTHSFIVMFKAENIGSSEMHAILTPSTKGMRAALSDINFTMPLSQANNQANTSDLTNSMEVGPEKSDSNEETAETDNEKTSGHSPEDEDDDDEEICDEPDEWLEKMGLDSAVNFKASILKRNSKDQKKNAFLNFDNRPRSTLLFLEGGDVQALFNFLLNSKTCVSNSGPLTGIPPTLLSPTTFVGATLQKIKIEQNIIKSLTSEGNSLTQYALDFIGPIMPYHVHRLCNLFKITNEEFLMCANTYDTAAALNCVKNTKEYKDDVDTGSPSNALGITSFLDKSELDSLVNSHGIFGESQAIKSIHLKENMFKCNY